MEEILASIRRIISEDEPANGEKAEAASDVQESDDVLELTDVAEDEPEGEVAEEAVEQVEEETAEADAPAEDDPVEDEIDFDAPAEAAEDDLELREEAEIDEQPEPAAEPVAAAPAAPVPSASPDETALLGAEPAGSATSSLASLVQAVDRAHGGTPLGDANRTIEDLVKEVMRPMIREWLDENLPGLVDRLVRREIERLSRTAEGDD